MICIELNYLRINVYKTKEKDYNKKVLEILLLLL